MSQITKTQVLTMEYSTDGSPWVRVAAKTGIDLDQLEYSLDGSPWYGVEETTAGGVKTWLDRLISSAVKTINGWAIAAIKVITGQTK